MVEVVVVEVAVQRESALLGHYEPTAESNPLLFLVNGFYELLIPGVTGFFVLLVASDIFRRIRKRLWAK